MDIADKFKELAVQIATGKDVDGLDAELRKLTTDQLGELLRNIDFYKQSGSHSAPDKDGVVYNENGYVVVSLTNMHEKHIANKKMLSLVGFLYQSLLEYDDMYWTGKHKPDGEELDAANEMLHARKLVIKEHLDKLFVFNPEQHMRSKHWPYPEDLSRHVLPNKPAASRYNVVKLDMHDEPQTGTSDIVNPANVPLGDVFVPVPSHDIYEAWSAYERNNYNAIDNIIDDIYNSKSDIHYTLRVFETFPGSKEGLAAATEFRNVESRKLGISLDIVDKNTWVKMEQTNDTTTRIQYDTDVVMRSILEQQAKDLKVASQLLKHKTTRKKRAAATAVAAAIKSGKKSHLDVVEPRTKASMQKRSVAEKQTIEFDPPGIADYRSFMAESASGLLAPEDLELDPIEELVAGGADPRLFYENVDEDGIPLDSIVTKCLLNVGGKFVQKEIFIKEETSPN